MNCKNKAENLNTYSLEYSALPKANSGKKTIGKKIKQIEKINFFPNNLDICKADKIYPTGRTK